jgi:archaellum component FlaF (FlaF/FlaG flagellin family)
VIIVVLILIILGIHSCQISSRNSALKDYNNGVNSLIQQSDNTGSQLFDQLSGGGGASNATALQNDLNITLAAARKELGDASKLNAPSQVSTAQQHLLFALQMRVDGITKVDNQIQPALNTSTSKGAVNQIAAAMAYLYASDVVYIGYTEPEIAGALNTALGANNGETYNGGQFLPDLGWLTPTYVATKLGASLPAPPNAKCVSGQLVGQALNFASVGGTQLQTGATNTVAASPPPTFTLNVTNGGKTTLTGVKLKVSVTGTSVTGTGTIPQTTPGETTTGTVTLSSTPPTGTFPIVATVVPVHCETNTSNNSMTYSVTFQ